MLFVEYFSGILNDRLSLKIGAIKKLNFNFGVKLNNNFGESLYQ